MVIWTVISLSSHCQDQSGNNLYEFMTNYYHDNPYPAPGDTTKRSGFAKEYDRTFMIWGPRLYPHGNFQIAMNAITEYNQDFFANNQSGQQFNDVQWSPLGPMDVTALHGVDGIGQIHRITIDPNFNNNTNQTLYAASFYGGLWKSINKGASWEVVNTDHQLPITSVSDIAIDYSNSNNLFICTGIGDGGIEYISNPNWGIINPISTNGIFRSTDGGLHWIPINNGFIEHFLTAGVARRMVINPNNSNQLFVATSAGVFRTNNALDSEPAWNRCIVGLDSTDHEYRGVEFQPNHSSTIYTSGKDIYRSVDGGNTWNSITAPYGLNIDTLSNCKVNRINIAVTPADSTRLYAYIEGNYLCPTDTSCHKGQIAYIYMFKNNIWKRLLKQHCHTISGTIHGSDAFEQLSPSWLAIVASPVDSNLLFFGYTKIKSCRNVSADKPKWDYESEYWLQGYHNDCHALVIPQKNSSDPSYIQILMAATHGGISMKQIWYNPSTINWRYTHAGLNVSMIWSFDISKLHNGYNISGFQCNGTKIYYENNGNKKWNMLEQGDGYGAQIGYQDKQISFIKANEQFLRHEFQHNNNTPSFFTALEYGQDVLGKYNFLPFSPLSNARAIVPKTFQIHKHISDTTSLFGFTELYRRKHRVPSVPTDSITPDSLWQLQSDLYKGKLKDTLWKRQISEFAIAPGNRNYIYVVIGGQIDPTWGIVPPQLYRSTNGTNLGTDTTFKDMSDFLPYITPGDSTHPHHPIITGIAVHPSDPKKVWISFTGYFADKKVFFSSDAGVSWTNYDSAGSLPNLPVNGIVYQEGTNDRLYIATDAGVYVKNGPNATWARYGNIPNVRVTELKINPCTGKLCAATFGRGLWEADLLPSNNIFQEIDTTETWTNDRILENSFIVKAPHTLTITGTVYMPKHSKVVVETGAELVIDGGKITQNCGFLWKGIELWGNSNLSQTPVSNQSRILVENGGTIENAEIAILAGKRNADESGFLPAFSGGFVRCIDANFNNNKVSALFTPFYNYSNSYFRRCSFLTNSHLNDSVQLDAFIKLYGLDELDIEGCIFRNNREWNEVPLTSRGTGIFCDNSRIFVKEGCLINQVPCNDPVQTSFERLSRGIYSINNGSIAWADIRNSIFLENVKGLYISGSTGASHSIVTGNNFNVFRPGEEVVDSYGMYLDECSGYQVEENNFHSDGDYCDGIGLIVNNSIVGHSEINRIYRNTFSNLSYGSIAQNRNKNAVTGEGLCFKCNKFFDNYSDIAVTKDPNLPSSHDFGIATNQGTNGTMPNAPAGNMFDFSPLATHWDLDNGLDPFNYFYHKNSLPGFRLRPDFIQGQITIYPVSVQFIENQACPLTNNNIVTGTEIEAMQVANAMATNIDSTLNILVDGGSTEALEEFVLASTPPEAFQTHSDLLSASPYLTDTVVMAAIEKEDVLNNAMLRDILVANPHSAKSDSIVALLDNRTDPMPEYMVDEILRGTDSVSGKEILEAQKGYWNSESSSRYHRLIDFYRNDSLQGETDDSLAGILLNRNTSDAFEDLASLYFHKQDFVGGLAVLNNLPTALPLSEEQSRVHQSRLRFYHTFKQTMSDSLRVMYLDSAELATLDSIRLSGIERLNAEARNLQIACERLIWNEPIILPTGNIKASRMKHTNHSKSTKVNQISVFPNPATSYVIVSLDIDKQEDPHWIDIVNISGRIVESIPVTDLPNQKIIPLVGLSPGLYLIILRTNQGVLSQTKLTVF